MDSDKRLENVEKAVQENSGKLISIDERSRNMERTLDKIDGTLHGTHGRTGLHTRIDRLEQRDLSRKAGMVRVWALLLTAWGAIVSMIAKPFIYK